MLRGDIVSIMPLNFLSVTEQVAAHLRAELIRGRWGGTIPGRNHLAKDLGANRKTVDAALKLLEEEGLLVSQGPRRKRKVVLPEGAMATMRIANLAYSPGDRQVPYMLELQHQAAGAAGGAPSSCRERPDTGRRGRTATSSSAGDTRVDGRGRHPARPHAVRSGASSEPDEDSIRKMFIAKATRGRALPLDQRTTEVSLGVPLQLILVQ